MKYYTIKAFNKRRFRLMLYVYSQILIFKKASRRHYREKELEKILRKYPKWAKFED